MGKKKCKYYNGTRLPKCGRRGKPIVRKRPTAFRLPSFVFIILVAAALFFALRPGAVALAAGNDNEDAEKQLEDTVHEQLDNLNLSELDELIARLTADDAQLFGGATFREKVKSVLNGDFKLGYDSFFSAALNLLFGNLRDFIPLLAAVVAVALLYGILYNARADTGSAGTSKIIRFACMSVIVVIVMAAVTEVVVMTRGALNAMRAQMNVAFPVLLTLVTALGANASAAVYQPASVVLAQIVAGAMAGVVLPFFLFTLVLDVVGGLTGGARLTKASSFFSSLNKWIIGVVFTVFTAFLSIQGITAGAHDGISIRTAKYAISRYVPLIGGYISDGFSLLAAGTVLIKNAVGFSCVLLLFISVLKPVVAIAVVILGLRLTAAIVEPAADKAVADFLSATAKNLTMLIVMLLATGFMYFIMLLLVISTGNIVF
jgi:stage III sporulation protein AE